MILPGCDDSWIHGKIKCVQQLGKIQCVSLLCNDISRWLSTVGPPKYTLPIGEFVSNTPVLQYAPMVQLVFNIPRSWETHYDSVLCLSEWQWWLQKDIPTTQTEALWQMFPDSSNLYSCHSDRSPLTTTLFLQLWQQPGNHSDSDSAMSLLWPCSVDTKSSTVNNLRSLLVSMLQTYHPASTVQSTREWPIVLLHAKAILSRWCEVKSNQIPKYVLKGKLTDKVRQWGMEWILNAVGQWFLLMRYSCHLAKGSRSLFW